MINKFYHTFGFIVQLEKYLKEIENIDLEQTYIVREGTHDTIYENCLVIGYEILG